ncbi:MAG: hypothetical protein JNL28_12825 [Planctomycetes bacterium]|nr:hypothetical protein [Planctomycetota bacterium]
MATQVESQSQLQDFLEILKRRKWQVMLPALIVLSLGIAFAVIVPKKYVARTQIELRPVGTSISNKDGANAAFQIRSWNRLKKILQERENEEFLALSLEDQATFLKRVYDDVRVTTSGGAQSATFVNIEYVDVDRAWAMTYLRALRTDWIEDVVKRDRNKADDELRKLQIEKTRFERQLRDEESQLTELRRVNNLSPTQPTPGSSTTRAEDPLYERLKAAEAERKAIEREIPVLKVKLEILQRQYDEAPATLKRENVLEAQTNEGELRDLEIRITDLNEQMRGIKPQHPRFRRLSDELEAKLARRDQLQRLVTKGSIETTTVENPERAVLLKAIDALQLELAQKRATVGVLTAAIEADSARVAEVHDIYRDERELVERIGRLHVSLADATKAYNEQARLVDQLASPLANPFEITSDVLADSKPTEPNPWLIIGLAVVGGLGLGLAIAVVAEFSRSCFRNVADISRSMAIPILGAISPIETLRERRNDRLRRAVVAVSSLSLVFAILFVTWAWAKDAQLLSQGLRDAIESLRYKLR